MFLTDGQRIERRGARQGRRACCAPSSATGPSGLAELQAATGLPRATAHRLAGALERHGLVRRDGDGRFCLGLALVGLGHAAADGFPLAELARPGARRACATRPARACSCSCARATAGVASCRCSRPTACAGSCPRARCSRCASARPGGCCPASSGRGGWVESVEEREPGVASVSAPVVDADGRVLAAVSVSGPVERLSRQPGARYGAAVVAAAADVAAAAGADRGPFLTQFVGPAGRSASETVVAGWAGQAAWRAAWHGRRQHGAAGGRPRARGASAGTR